MSSVLFFDGQVFDKLTVENHQKVFTKKDHQHFQTKLNNSENEVKGHRDENDFLPFSRRHNHQIAHANSHHGHLGNFLAEEVSHKERSHHYGHNGNPEKTHPGKPSRHHTLESVKSFDSHLSHGATSNQSISGFASEPLVGEKLHQTLSLDRNHLAVEEMNELWKIAMPIDEAVITDKVARLKSLLHLNGVSKSTFKSYCVRVLDNSIIFPRYSQTEAFEGLDYTPSGVKLYRYDNITSSPNPVTVDVLPRENVFNGMFGYNLINPTNHDVVLTSREADALAIFQAMKYSIPALVLPGNVGPLSYDALPYLEQFRKITIWLPVHQYSSAQHFARRLGLSRCFIVTAELSTHGAAELLSVGNANAAYEKISHLLANAKAASLAEDVDTFESLRASAKDHVFGTGRVAGIVQWTRFPLLNHILKGFRLGELTILTGQTGCGKTTFLSEYSLDLCEQNISTLWCSFEIPNSRLVSILVHQYARKDFVQHNGEFDFWYDKLLKLPMYFAKFDHNVSLSKITEEIDNLIVNRNIQHVIVDNLQYMLESTDVKHSENEYAKMRESICENFRTLANQRNVHITIVIYANVSSDEHITLDALLGSLKTSQQADNILLIQRKIYKAKEPYFEKYLQVCKNRFAGEVALGERLQMFFDYKSKCHRLAARSKTSAPKN